MKIISKEHKLIFTIFMFDKIGEMILKKSTLIAKPKILLRGWRVSFKINPFGTINGWTNILHATIGRNHGKYGDRTPGIWFHSKTTKLFICSAVNGNTNYCYTSSPIPLHKTSSIIVQQVQWEKDFQYYYQIFINGKNVFSLLNHLPKVLKDVKYYASNPWHTPAKATFSNFKLAMFKHKGKF